MYAFPFVVDDALCCPLVLDLLISRQFGRKDGWTDERALSPWTGSKFDYDMVLRQRQGRSFQQESDDAEQRQSYGVFSNVYYIHSMFLYYGDS